MTSPSLGPKKRRMKVKRFATIPYLFHYYQKTSPDCHRLLHSIPQTLLHLRNICGWGHNGFNDPNSPQTLEALQELLCQLLEEHSETLQESLNLLESDEGYVPMVFQMLEEQLALESQRRKDALLDFRLSCLQKNHASPQDIETLLDKIKPPQHIPLLVQELEGKIQPWQKSLSAYVTNYPYCLLLDSSAKKTLSGDPQQIREAIQELQTFKHPLG